MSRLTITRETTTSDIMKLTAADLKFELGCRGRGAYMPRTKPELVGRLMMEHALKDNINVISNFSYYPRDNDRAFGIVSNFPLKYQEKVCYHFASALRLGKRLDFMRYHANRNNANNDTHLLVTNPHAAFRNCLYYSMTFFLDVAELTAFYTGFNCMIFEDLGNRDRPWTWKADDKGRILVDILVDLVATRWQERVKAHQEEVIRYNNPQWGFNNPLPAIADEIQNLITKKREKVKQQRALRETLRKTFLYGCTNPHSGAAHLPLIGARYAYGPIRKQIAQYVGAVDA